MLYLEEGVGVGYPNIIIIIIIICLINQLGIGGCTQKAKACSNAVIRKFTSETELESL